MMDEKDEIIQLLEFDVSGMSCDRCAMWVTEAIKKNVENVVDVRVKSVKTTERNVCVSLKLLSSSSDDDDDEKKGASSSSKTETKNIIRALELAGYGCVESNENNRTMKTTRNPGVFLEEEEEEEKERLIKSSSNSASSFTEKQTIKSKTYHFNVEGMTCASCVSGVENAIKSLPTFEDDVISFSVNLLSESATVVIANDSKLKPDDIANEISDFGFDCAVSKPDAMKFNVSGMVCQSCPPRIENAILKRFPNDVVSVSASELLEKVVVEMKPGTSVGARDILYAIQSLGYGCEIWNENENDEKKGRKSKLIERKYKKQFLLSVPLALPLLLMMIVFDPIDETKAFFMQKVDGNQRVSLMWIISWILATPAQFILGYQFYARAFSAMKHKTATMDTLIAMGTSAAYFYSVYVVLKNVFSKSHDDEHKHGKEDAIFFETSTVLISFVLLGKWLEARAKGKASEAIQKLVSLAPNTAIICEVINNNTEAMQIVSEREIDSNLLQRDDVVKVVPGSAFPVDGVVLSGETAADESAITGESLPVPKTKNSFVIAGTTNTFGTVFVAATNVGAERALNKIVRLVEDAQTSKAPIQARADKISAVFVPSVVALAFLSFIFWLIAVKATTSVPKSWTDDEGEFVFCFVFFVTVLVIACPCALGLATPTAVMVGTGVGAKLGILIKGGEPLEIAHDVTVVCFDKTGTLTLGKPTVVEVFCAPGTNVGIDEAQLLKIAAVAEKSSEHPLGKAIVLYVEEDRQLDVSDLSVSNFAAVPGRGLECMLRSEGRQQEKKLRVGNSDFILDDDGSKAISSSSFSEIIRSCEEKGRTVVCVELDGVFLGFIALADKPRPEAQKALRALKQRNVEIAMVSGDNKAVCETIARQIGSIDYIFSQCLPRDKVNCVKELQARERKPISSNGGGGGSSSSSRRRTKNGKNVVAFVGDGVNDAPAMTRADIGIAVGAGTDIAMEAAGIVLVKSDIFDVVHALDLSRATFRRIEMNLFFSLGYNALGIPIAAGLLYPFVKVRLPPEVAGLAMALSSVSVVTSSLMLKRFKRCKEEEEFEDEAVVTTDDIV
ncbi:unnamed protein product [Bathycoccus prasinos]